VEVELRERPKERRRAQWWLRVLICVCLVFLAGVAVLYFRQHSMLYHPRPYDASYAQALPAGGVELDFKTIAGKQVAFYLPPGGGSHLPKRIWVAFCGNGSLALDWTWLLGQDSNSGDAFLLIDYPGYGKSEGYATIGSTRAGADKALEALASHLGVREDEIESRLNVIGHSWGAAVALDFATRHPVQRIVLISVFTTLREEAAIVVGGFLSHLLVENYDNRACLHELSRRSSPPRIAIFHGTEDDDIPIRMGRELAAGFPAFVTFHPVPGGDHVSVIGKAASEILAAIND
jgi:pimeloyl-ACP methyl ester carboxylesterase